MVARPLVQGRKAGRLRTRREVLRAGTKSALGILGAAVASFVPEVRRGRAARRVTRPNFVVVLSDNHRADAIGIAGHPFVRTPALDRLAREGVRFERAYCTTPLCSPARASFLTGLYAYRHGVKNHTTQASWDEKLVTFFELLQSQAGYRNGFVGKWHMPASPLPRLRGVERFVTFTIEGGQGRYFDCPLVVDGRPEPSRRRYITEELTDRAIDFVREGPEPFCLYLAHKAVHHPWKPPPDLEGIYSDEPVHLPKGANSWTGFTNGQIWGGFDRPVESAYRAYMETVTGMDREIGRLLRFLDDRGLAGRTFVLYASDNGFLFGEHKRVELRWPFEEVIRIPWIVRWPQGVERPGRVARQMVLNLDLAPTLLELAGLDVPDWMQGRSFLPVLADPDAPGRRAWLVENYREFPYRVPGYQGVHTERYLYVEYEGCWKPSLHDLLNDPKQERDLYGTEEGDRVLPELRRLLAGLRHGEKFDA
ncbi:MAG: acetylglucosamine-6-sulfatase [Candidatus Binatia bacterium]|nr:MAG: acetylglucosamine-6-sulfatase [Candidatus Binatia bacterium]